MFNSTSLRRALIDVFRSWLRRTIPKQPAGEMYMLSGASGDTISIILPKTLFGGIAVQFIVSPSSRDKISFQEVFLYNCSTTTKNQVLSSFSFSFSFSAFPHASKSYQQQPTQPRSAHFPLGGNAYIPIPIFGPLVKEFDSEGRPSLSSLKTCPANPISFS